MQKQRKKPTTYICLDTNILVRYVTQGKDGCEERHWDSLARLLSAGEATLLVPEVIALEFEKHHRSQETLLDAHTKLVSDYLTGLEKVKGLWNEVADIVEYLKDRLEEWLMDKTSAFNLRSTNVVTLLNAPQTVKLALTPDIVLGFTRRKLGGRLPLTSGKSDADCMIVECLHAHFAKSNTDYARFFLCTENLKDFGLETKGQVFIHPEYKEGLPANQLFLTLADLMAELDKPPAQIKQPTSEDISTGLEREKQEAIADIVEQPNPWSDYPLDISVRTPEGILALESISRQIQAMRYAGRGFEGFRRLAEEQRMVKQALLDASRGSEVLRHFAEDHRMIEKAMRDLNRGSEVLRDLEENRRMIERALQDSTTTANDFQAAADRVKEAVKDVGIPNPVAQMQPPPPDEIKKPDEPPKPRE